MNSGAAEQDAPATDRGDELERPSEVPSSTAWLPYVLPIIVYMALGLAEPKPIDSPPATGSVEPSTVAGLTYPIFYTIRVSLTLVAALVALPVYRSFPFRVHPLSVFVGVAGGIAWILLCRLNVESALSELPILSGLLSSGERSGYNPFVELTGRPIMLVLFLGVRFFGLVLLIPLIEEFFLRGFLMRFVIDGNWPQVTFGTATTFAICVGTLYGVIAHPAEILAAAVWFSLITWLMIRTRNMWDCVVAHMVTNLALGLYVVIWQDWRLW